MRRFALHYLKHPGVCWVVSFQPCMNDLLLKKFEWVFNAQLLIILKNSFGHHASNMFYKSIYSFTLSDPKIRLSGVWKYKVLLNACCICLFSSSGLGGELPLTHSLWKTWFVRAVAVWCRGGAAAAGRPCPALPGLSLAGLLTAETRGAALSSPHKAVQRHHCW